MEAVGIETRANSGTSPKTPEHKRNEPALELNENEGKRTGSLDFVPRDTKQVHADTVRRAIRAVRCV